MNFSKLCPAFIFLLMGINIAFAQTLDVKLNRSFFKPGDTLMITAGSSNAKPLATLFLMAEHEEGMVWEMRWPMLNGQAEASLVIPDSLPAGNYRLRFSQLQDLFTVFGKVHTPKLLKTLKSTLLTPSDEIYERDLAVSADGKFTYKNVLFQDEATIVFTLPEERFDEDLDIEISTVLDSIILPRKDVIQYVYIGSTEPETATTNFSSINDNPYDSVQVLQAVTVYAAPENRAAMFNKKYPSPLFRDINEKLIDVMDNPYNKTAMNVLQVLRISVPGITLYQGAHPYATWRGERVSFYLDEVRSTMWEVEAIPLNDVAIIKAFPPPFMANIPAGAGGAVAVYTRRGAFAENNFKNAFKVKGYTAPLSVFPVQPDRL